ncbi:MAG: glycosyltransferase family 4 protein [Pirellulales bacterium]
MKIAIISYGFAEYCVQQANGLARHGDVLLLLPRDEAEPYLAQLDSAVHFCPFAKPRLRQPARQIIAAAGLVRQLRRFQPDVIHIQHGHMWFNLALPWLRSFPLVMTIHDPRHHVGDRASRKTPQPLMDFGFRRADRVIVHGEVLKRQLADELRISSQKIHVIPHVALGPVDGLCEADEAAPQILFFGRIWKYKGLEHLIQAQPMISQALPAARIVIAGQGDDFEPYRRMIVEPGRFTVHNRFIELAERDELFRRASVVVLPYITATQSGVIPLAYAYGKPVVATNVGALCEAVEDGVTGRLVPPSDPAALARAVIDLLSDRARCHAMGAAGKRKLDAECSPAIVADQTMAVYQRAIQDHKSWQRLAAPAPAAESLPKSC